MHVPKEMPGILGFDSAMKFTYIIGQPLCMLYFSIFFFVRVYFRTKNLVDIIASMMLMGVAFFFITYCLWDRQDLPKQAYFAALGVLSVSSCALTYLIVKGIKLIQAKTSEKYVLAVSTCRKLFSLINETRKKLPLENRKELLKDLHNTIEG